MAACVKCKHRPQARPRRFPGLIRWCATCVNNARRDLRIRKLRITEEALRARLEGASPEVAAEGRRATPAPRLPDTAFDGIPASVLELQARLTQLDGDEAHVAGALIALRHAVAGVRRSPVILPAPLDRALRGLERALAVSEGAP